jgi:hypothetical protein
MEDGKCFFLGLDHTGKQVNMLVVGCQRLLGMVRFCMLQLGIENKGALHHTVASRSSPSVTLCCCDSSILQKPHQLPHGIMHHHLRVAFHQDVELRVLGWARFLASGVE